MVAVASKVQRYIKDNYGGSVVRASKDLGFKSYSQTRAYIATLVETNERKVENYQKLQGNKGRTSDISGPSSSIKSSVTVSNNNSNVVVKSIGGQAVSSQQQGSSTVYTAAPKVQTVTQAPPSMVNVLVPITPPSLKPTVTPVTTPVAGGRPPTPAQATFSVTSAQAPLSGANLSAVIAKNVLTNATTTNQKTVNPLTSDLLTQAQAQQTRQSTSDKGLQNVRTTARVLTGGKMTGAQGYEQRSFTGKVAENLVFGALSFPQQIGRGVSIAGEKIVLTAKALTNTETRGQVLPEAKRTAKSKEFTNTFDIRTPEGVSTYIGAAGGAFFPAASRTISTPKNAGSIVSGTYKTTTSKGVGQISTKTVTTGTIRSGGKNTPFVRESTLKEVGATGKADYSSKTVINGKTFRESGSGRTFDQQISGLDTKSGGNIQVKGRMTVGQDLTFQTSKSGGTIGGIGTTGTKISVGRIAVETPSDFTSFIGAQKSGRFITQVSRNVKTGYKVEAAKFGGKRGELTSTEFNIGTGTGGTGFSSPASVAGTPRIGGVSFGTRRLSPVAEAGLAAQYFKPNTGISGVSLSGGVGVRSNELLYDQNIMRSGSAVGSLPASIPVGPQRNIPTQKPIISILDGGNVRTQPSLITNPKTGGKSGGKSAPKSPSTPDFGLDILPTDDTAPVVDTGTDYFSSSKTKTKNDFLKAPSYIIPTRGITRRPSFGFGGFALPPIGGGGGGFGLFGGFTSQPKAYTPSLFSAFTGYTASEEPDMWLIKSGIGIRPVIRRKGRGFAEAFL